MLNERQKTRDNKTQNIHFEICSPSYDAFNIHEPIFKSLFLGFDSNFYSIKRLILWPDFHDGLSKGCWVRFKSQELYFNPKLTLKIEELSNSNQHNLILYLFAIQ